MKKGEGRGARGGESPAHSPRRRSRASAGEGRKRVPEGAVAQALESPKGKGQRGG